jgi:hypothetical protein
MFHVAVEVCLQRHSFGVTGFEATIAGDREAAVHARHAATLQAAACDWIPIDIFPSPDFPEMILEPGATFRLRKPFTPNGPPAALNRCLAKPIANARLAQ